MKFRIVELNNGMFQAQVENASGEFVRLWYDYVTLEEAQEVVREQKLFEVKRVVEVIE